MVANALYVIAGLFLSLSVIVFVTFAGHAAVGSNALFFVLGLAVLGGIFIIAGRKARKREMKEENS